MEKGKMTKSLAFLTVILAIVLSVMLGVFVTGYYHAGAFSTMEKNGDFYPDYATMEEAQAAAKALNIQMAEEGTILLKNNNNALPVARTERVSVFGTSSDSIQGAAASGRGATAIEGQTQDMAQALADEGYMVNPALHDFYAANSYNTSSQGREETTEFGAAVERSYKEYNDVAFITLTRFLQEGTGAGDHNTVLNGKSVGAERAPSTNRDGSVNPNTTAKQVLDPARKALSMPILRPARTPKAKPRRISTS